MELSVLVELRDLYARDWPKQFQGWNTLDNFIAWLKRVPKLKDAHLHVGGNWRESGLFVIVDRYQLFINAINTSDHEVFETLRHLDWTRGYKISALPERYYSAVGKFLREINISFQDVLLNSYCLDKEKALKFSVDCPPNYKIRVLEPSDAHIINELWYSQQRGSLGFLTRLIKYNLSIGICLADTNALVAWATKCQCGYLGTLHVRESFRRQGLAQVVIKAFSRQIAETGQDVYVQVAVCNQRSNDLFRKLAFAIVERAYHMKAYRVSEQNLWPKDD